MQFRFNKENAIYVLNKKKLGETEEPVLWFCRPGKGIFARGHIELVWWMRKKHIGAKLWNSLPASIKTSPSLVNFKKKVKVFLYDKMVSVEQNEFILY